MNCVWLSNCVCTPRLWLLVFCHWYWFYLCMICGDDVRVRLCVCVSIEIANHVCIGNERIRYAAKSNNANATILTRLYKHIRYCHGPGHRLGRIWVHSTRNLNIFMNFVSGAQLTSRSLHDSFPCINQSYKCRRRRRINMRLLLVSI